MKLLNWEIHGVIFFVVKIVLDWDAWATYFLQILQQCCSKMKHLISKYLVQAKTAITHFPFPEYMNIRFIVYKNTNKVTFKIISFCN